MNTEQMREMMMSLVDTVRERRAEAVYRLIPTRGWYTLDGDTRVETPMVGIVPLKALETIPAYTLVDDGGRIVWQLMREPHMLWYYLTQMELEDNDTIVYRFYALASNQLATFLLEQLGHQHHPHQEQHDG